MTPDDERKRVHERERGVMARAILESPLWAETYEGLQKDELARILAASTPDDEVLEGRRRVRALYAVKKRLETVLQTGQMADIQLQEQEARDG